MALLGVEVGMNFRINTKLFNEGMKTLTYTSDQFTKSFEATAAKFTANTNYNIELLKDRAKSIIPELGNLNKIAYSKGEEFVLNRALEKSKGLLDDVSQKMAQAFGSGKKIDGKFLLPEEELKAFQESLQYMQTTDLKKLDDSMESIFSSMDDFSPQQQKLIGETFKSMQDNKTPKNLKEAADVLDRIRKTPMAKMKKDFKDWSDGVRSSLGYILGLGSLVRIFTDILEVQTEMSKNIWQMGMVGKEAFSSIDKSMVKTAKSTISTRAAVRKSADDFMKMNARVASSTRASLSEVGATMGELMRMRVGGKAQGDFEKLTETSILMGKALGMSTSSANNFIKDLSLIGGVGADDIRVAAEEILNVKENLGLSEDEAVLVGQTVGRLVRQFRTFGGGSSKDVKIVTKELSKMSAAFTSVGLSASDASTIVTDMMNPENLQKSVLLWNSMGMSAADGFAMMHGEGSKMEDMTKKMVGVAKDLKAQYGGNHFALKAMADAHGLSLEQVQALSQYDDKALDDMAKKAKLEEASQAAQQGINDLIKTISNQLLIILQTFVLPFVKHLSNALAVITDILAWVNKLANGKYGEGKGAGQAIQAFIILGTLFITGLLPKLLKGLLLLKGGLAGVVGNLKGGMITAMKFGKSLLGAIAHPIKSLGKLGQGIKGILKTAPNIGDAELPAKKPKGAISKLKGEGKTPSIDGAKPQPKSPLLEQLSKMSKGQLWAIGGAIALIVTSITLLVLAVVLLAKAMKDLNPEQINGLILTMAVIMGGMIGIMLAFALTINILGAAGLAAAPGIWAIGGAIALIAVGVAAVILALAVLVKVFSGLGENAGAIAIGITSIVSAIASMIIATAFLVGAVALLSWTMTSAAAGVAIFAIALVALALTMPLLTGIGLAARGAGEAFLNMGVGIKLMVDSLKEDQGVIKGLQALKKELGGGWAGIANDAIKEIERINASLADMQKMTLGSMATNIVANVTSRAVSEKDAASGAETSDYVSQFNTANTHLSAISQNTLKTNDLLKELIVETKRKVNIRTNITMTANMGVSG